MSGPTTSLVRHLAHDASSLLTDSITDDTKKSGQRMVGDVDFESASEVASYITPVLGAQGMPKGPSKRSPYSPLINRGAF